MILADELDVGYSASREQGGGTGLTAEPVYSADFLLALPSHHPRTMSFLLERCEVLS